jgi:hypothetical protein
MLWVEVLNVPNALDGFVFNAKEIEMPLGMQNFDSLKSSGNGKIDIPQAGGMKRFSMVFICLFFILIFAKEDGAPVPGTDYFPISASDWVYMVKHHEDFSENQKVRAAYQALALKLDEACNCGVTTRVLEVSNNEGRFWEKRWKDWPNNFIENQRVLDVLMNTIENLKVSGYNAPLTVPSATNERIRW